jgi:2-oxoglutarate ferredoxin oxidoreductase subunit gamma
VSGRFEVLLAGTGGQGVIMAAVILAEAAATHDGKNAAQTQSYAPAVRGGACQAEVVICDDEIDYPKVTHADALLAMSQEACDRYEPLLKADGVLIVDSILVERVPRAQAHEVPLTEIAEQESGRRVTANLVGLGVLVGLTHAVSQGAIEAALASRAPTGTLELNLKALRAGLRLADQLAKERSTSRA